MAWGYEMFKVSGEYCCQAPGRRNENAGIVSGEILDVGRRDWGWIKKIALKYPYQYNFCVNTGSGGEHANGPAKGETR